MGHARTVTILVAPGYAPFEQYYSSGENQGPWTDLYSLGATCYRAIAGIPPMDAIARSKGILGSTREILIPAATIGSGRYSPALLEAVDHALQFAEKDRPQTIAEWRRELTAAGRVTPRHAPATLPVTPATAPSMRGPVMWASLGAVVAAVAVAAILLMWQSRQQPHPGNTEAEKLIKEIKRAEAERREQEARQQKEREAAAQRQREEQQKQEAARREAAEQEKARREADARKTAAAQKKADAERARKEAEAKKKADSEKALREAEARKAEADKIAKAEKAEAERKRKEAEQLAPKVAPPKPAAPGTELLAQAEQAQARGNEAESLALYRKAANAGNAEAQFRLGEMSAAGKGVAQSHIEAYIWFSLAANNGHVAARARRDRVILNLQPAEIQQADRLIDSQARGARPR
jgi:hypothetical protein